MTSPLPSHLSDGCTLRAYLILLASGEIEDTIDHEEHALATASDWTSRDGKVRKVVRSDSIEGRAAIAAELGAGADRRAA